jgi:hypothetical protein
LIVELRPEPAKPSSRERKPARNRAGHYLVIILGSGGLAALLAIAIAGIPTVLSVAFPAEPSQLPASQVFPSVSPTHQVVNVYDPAPKQAPPPPARPTAPPQHASPTPDDGGHNSPRPSGSPPPDD